LGMHGRIANIPAKNVNFGAEWEEDEYVLWASGDIRETSLFGANLLLRRSIHARLGQSRVWIKDVIVNQGFEAAPLMFLYHCNTGFPLVSEGAELLAVINNLEPRDKEAEKGVEQFDRMEAPTARFSEQCFFLDHDADEKNIVNLALVNRPFKNNQGLGLYMAFPKSELPYFTVWKMVGEGTYVVGLEPGNCLPEGRSSARKHSRLAMVQPQEELSFHLELGVLTSNDEIQLFENRLRGQTV
ncbi:aldose 1-epimerase family protein, partial [candidate division KSB1 bacterium]|nr:aldose 1-epimerase family protein [candidate division KSB1 bacterium]